MNYSSNWYLINIRIERYNKLLSPLIPVSKTRFPVKILSAAEYKERINNEKQSK